MLFEIIVCLLAGIGAGLCTGLASISAATVISPLLIALLGFDAYEALGIALASDVLASALAAATYGRQKQINIRRGLPVLMPAVLFTFVGSFVGYSISHGILSYISLLGLIAMGGKFLFAPVKENNQPLHFVNSRRRDIVVHLMTGVVIGSICGFCGVGGGMMMLLVFTVILGYDMKEAVGTSVFIMTATALVGAVSHFAFIGSVQHLTALFVCGASTLLFAVLSAHWATRISNKSLNRAIGICLGSLGIILFLIHVLT